MNKLYERIDFHNNTTPALNETNLNLISKAVDDIDNRVCEIAADVIQDVPILLELAQSVEPNAERAEKAAEDAQEYAQEAATGVGANGLEYTEADNKLKLKRDEYVIDEVELGGSGTSDYSDLDNKPSINNIVLAGNKTLNDLGIAQPNVFGSDAYDSTKSYAVGDTCIDDNTLWKCKIPCVGARPSTDSSGSWERISLASLGADWKHFSGQTIPADAKELKILVIANAMCADFHIDVKTDLTDSYRTFMRGYMYTSQYGACFTLRVNKTNFVMETATVNGVSTSVVFDCYYK